MSDTSPKEDARLIIQSKDSENNIINKDIKNKKSNDNNELIDKNS